MLSYRSEIRVRYAETDQMGVVHHSVYPVWFEAARSDLFRAMHLPYSEFEENGIIIMVTEMNCRFLKPAHYDELIEVEVIPRMLTPVRLQIDYQVTRPSDGALVATGYTRHAFADKQGRPINLKKTPFWSKLVEALPDIITTTKKSVDER